MKQSTSTNSSAKHEEVSPASPSARSGRQSDRQVDWQLYTFEQFDLWRLYSVLRARVAVFVLEQDCPYQDLDGLDEAGLHLVGWGPGPSVAAYARVLPPGTRFQQPSIGRVLTATQVRRTGLGRALMRRAIEVSREHWPTHPIRLSAQCYLERFYEGLGFSVVSQPYEEDGIPHVEMELPAAVAGSSPEAK